MLRREILGRDPKVGRLEGWFQDIERRPDRERQRTDKRGEALHAIQILEFILLKTEKSSCQ